MQNLICFDVKFNGGNTIYYIKMFKKKLMPIAEENDSSDEFSFRSEGEFEDYESDFIDSAQEEEFEMDHYSKQSVCIKQSGDMDSRWMKPVPIKSFKKVLVEGSEKLLKSEVESLALSSNDQTVFENPESSSLGNIEERTDTSFAKSTIESNWASNAGELEVSVTPNVGIPVVNGKYPNHKISSISTDHTNILKRNQCKKNTLQTYINDLNNRVNQIPERYFPYIETIENSNNIKIPPLAGDSLNVDTAKATPLLEDVRQRKLGKYKLDSVAADYINQALFQCNPRYHILPNPYNSLNDPRLKKHFEQTSIRKLFYKNGILQKCQNVPLGEVIGAKHEDDHFQMGKYKDYLFRRNLSGLGRSDENRLGHSDFSNKYFKAKLKGWNGEEGYRNNTPSLRAKSCIGFKTPPVINDKHCVITASVYNSHPAVTRNWIRNDYIGEFVRETKNRLPPKNETYH